ncbi:hypothetical protein DEFDS_P241 (plasmid) [Deferribacter desulfuricans SSM1]|uniref:Uncharacterized protein n=1 Tax=Deferribacter desulfuricans (strain DSM 14783 / JCM 11476 / NBRC 101012 / SSM1) TaxID=639282 RepID=D3PF69_DEFDS|nr:hypothetical protein [Deferribacter desulfuricans]BAI81861.1 hypothetical protein DEFDS_P241 [Deferribacter desulfuricans SSM1]
MRYNKNIKFITFIILCIFILSQLSYASGFQDFVVKSQSKKTLGIGGKATANSVSKDFMDAGGSTSIGIKTDCNQIKLDFDFNGFFKDIINELKDLLNDQNLKNILIVNAILDLVSYSYATQKCSTKLPKDITLGPIINKAIADTKQCVSNEIGDLLDFKNKSQGGAWWNPSGSCKHPPCLEPWRVREKEGSVKPQKSVSAGYCNYSKLKQLLGEDFMKCVHKEQKATLEMIIKMLNWKAGFNLKQTFKLQEECKLSAEQKELDLVMLYKKAKEEGDITLATWRLPSGKVFRMEDDKITIELADDYLPTKDREEVYNQVIDNFGDYVDSLVYEEASLKTYGDKELLQSEIDFLTEKLAVYLDTILLADNTIKSIVTKCKLNLETILDDAMTLQKQSSDYFSKDLNSIVDFIKYKDLLNVLFYGTYKVCKDYILTYNSKLAEHINNLTEFINGKSYKVNTDIMKNELKKFNTAIKELNKMLSVDMKNSFVKYNSIRNKLNKLSGDALSTIEIKYNIGMVKDILAVKH